MVAAPLCFSSGRTKQSSAPSATTFLIVVLGVCLPAFWWSPTAWSFGPHQTSTPHHTHTGIRRGARWFSFRFTELISASVST